ncbi:hypothetical protein M3666_15390 [Curtobacterium sp. ODYSSEY 48 V2]|uniref:hypothetical protein n=1 Tax=Curtobacterium sp. ODYSSEY 48 V2 TaxID=2939561 RepID=UPI00203B54A7|nr:hypothetical protein [Curtobacterium sp. ODYSSEY 48 V2]MCM3506496.1 hypothetical protein [Curtobacterium sp. ODYSSEY 48 V2]
MPYEPIIPEGQHLGTSHDVDGAATGHLFDNGTNRLVGHAAWRWVDEPDDEPVFSYEPDPPRELTPEEIEAAAQLAGLILAGIVIGIEVAAPHVRRWWSSSVVPWGKTVRARVSAAVKKFRKEEPQAGFVEEAMFVASSTGVVLARPDEIRMTSAEWERRFRSMLIADAFAQEQMRVLSIARVNDRQTVLQEPSESEVLTATQFVERVKLMLEANPSLLNSETSTALMQVFDPRNGLPREL